MPVPDPLRSTSPAGRTTPRLPEPQPLHVPTRSIVLAGTAVWVVALALTLLVPSLHEGGRHWWPWTCVTGVALGVVALVYVGRGRGNAADA